MLPTSYVPWSSNFRQWYKYTIDILHKLQQSKLACLHILLQIAMISTVTLITFGKAPSQTFLVWCTFLCGDLFLGDLSLHKDPYSCDGDQPVSFSDIVSAAGPELCSGSSIFSHTHLVLFLHPTVYGTNGVFVCSCTISSVHSNKQV